MKALGFVTAIVLVCVAGVAQADLITNGDFSMGGTGGNSGLTGWTIAHAIVEPNPVGQGYSLLGDSGANGYGAIEQNVTNHPFALGETYTVSLQARYEEGNSVANQVAMYFQTPAGATTLLEEHIPLTDTFVTHTYTYSVDPSVVSSNWRIFIQADAPYGTGIGWMDVNDVSVTATVTPEPAMVTLLLTALAGLLAYAWRKRR